MKLHKSLLMAAMLLVGTSALARTSAALPLGGVLQDLGSANQTATETEARRQIEQKATRFKSDVKENKVFEGTFIPASSRTRLAVLSDDGVTITIDGAATNVSKFQKDQPITDFPRSFIVVNKADFVAGRSYQVKVEYSNTKHINNADFDGMTLFAFGNGGRVEEVNLLISNGQGGSVVPEDDEDERRGAFTVANLNNTDNDATVDNSDNDVPGEKDLMALEISRPNGPATDKVTVKVTAGSARLWQSSTKGTPVPLVNGAAEFTLGSLPRTIYLEATTTSPSLRSVSVELDYKGNKDTVKATGVWSELVAVEHDTKSYTTLFAESPWSDFPDPGSRTYPTRGYARFVGGSGLLPPDHRYGIANMILMKFAVYPSGIGKEPGVKFDVARQAAARVWSRNAGDLRTTVYILMNFPAHNERANDSSIQNGPGNTGETRVPTESDHIYQIDIPGMSSLDANKELLVYTGNFREFVRVKFDDSFPEDNVISGSRCSNHYLWHVKHRLVRRTVNGMPQWSRPQDDLVETDDNQIGPGHITLIPIP